VRVCGVRCCEQLTGSFFFRPFLPLNWSSFFLRSYLVNTFSSPKAIERGKHDLSGLARSLETRAVERYRVELLSLSCGTLQTDANLRKMPVVVCCAVEVDLCTDERLDDSLDLLFGVVSRLAGDDAILAKSGGKIVAMHHIDGSVPVVKIAIGAIVNSGGAGTVLLSLVKNKLAALKSGPEGVKLLLKLGIVVDRVENVLTSVGAFAARRIVLSFIIGPHTMQSETGRIGVNASRKAAAAITAERARP